jgi:hypothetical protein
MISNAFEKGLRKKESFGKYEQRRKVFVSTLYGAFCSLWGVIGCTGLNNFITTTL